MSEIRLYPNTITAIVDDEDEAELTKHRWYLVKTRNGHLYAYTKIPRITGPTVLMHRFIMKPPPGLIVHHINGNGLDNRRRNLEIASYSYNNMEIKRRSK